MTVAYCINGEPVEKMAHRALALTEGNVTHMNSALIRVAKSLGYKNWLDLLDDSIHVAADITETYCVERRIEGGRVTFNFEQLLYALIKHNNKNMQSPLPRFALSTAVTTCERSETDTPSLNFMVRFDQLSEANIKGHDVFTPKGQATIADLNEAFQDLWKGKPALLLTHLSSEGFLDVKLCNMATSQDPDTILEIALRKRNLNLGRRIVFIERPMNMHTLQSFCPAFCSINELKDGRVVISNSATAIEALRYRIVSRARLNELVAQMESELGDKAYSTNRGERWFLSMHFKPYLV